jgi:hypothetical protein
LTQGSAAVQPPVGLPHLTPEKTRALPALPAGGTDPVADAIMDYLIEASDHNDPGGPSRPPLRIAV